MKRLATWIAIIALFAPLAASAAQIFQYWDSAGAADFLVTAAIGCDYQAEGPFTFAQTGRIDGAVFYARKAGGTPTDDLVAYLMKGGSDPDNGTMVASGTLANADIPSAYQGQVGILVPFNTSHTVASTSDQYWLKIGRSTAGSPSDYFAIAGAGSGNPISGPTELCRSGVGGGWASGTNADLTWGFWFGANNGLNGLDFIFPYASSTFTDFGQWRLDYSYSTSSVFAGTLDVRYSRTSSSSFDFHDPLRLGHTPTSTEVAVLKSQPLLYPPLPDNTQWWVWADLFDSNGTTVVASTTPFQISMVYVATSSVYTSTSTLSSTPQCTGSGVVGDSFCGAGVFLFYPTQASLNQFGNLKNALANKPPFGYITSLNTALGTLSSSASSSVDLSAIAGTSSSFSGFRALIAWVLWLLFGFWIYNKFRHFKF